MRQFHLTFFQMVGEWWDFTVVTKLIRKCKSLYGFGRRSVSTLEALYGYWHQPCSKVFVYPKCIKLSQLLTTLNAIFHVIVSVYRLINFENRPSSLRDFGMACLQQASSRYPHPPRFHAPVRRLTRAVCHLWVRCITSNYNNLYCSFTAFILYYLRHTLLTKGKPKNKK